ncbi:MAG TPA: hypothetical protein VKV74_00225 [Bryobacteraceae bacterium]|nr:hypothetical protein [Bryobacteraceae bacterium]
MAATGSVAVRKTVGFLSDPSTGIGWATAQIANDTGIALATIPAANIFNQNVSFELAEKAQAVKYPAIYVYTDRVRNLQTEKFRTFSGKVRTIAEVRVSQDRLEGLEDQLRLYVDGVTQVLDGNRGSWGEGAFFTGAYEVAFEPIKHGGKNYLQAAKVAFEVDMSE